MDSTLNTSPAQPLRVGLVGAGLSPSFISPRCSRFRRRAWRRSAIGRRARRSFARQHGIESAFDSLDTMLKTAKLDVVHVLAPPPQHAAAATRCLEAGCHVLAEKPLTVTAEEGRALCAVAERSGRRLGVNHNFIWHPAFMQLVDAAQSWWFGRLRHVVASWSVPLRQLQSGQFDHWMFGAPATSFSSRPSTRCRSSRICSAMSWPRPCWRRQGSRCRRACGRGYLAVALQCERGTAQCVLNFAGGFPQTSVNVIGEDAVGCADLRLNTFVMTRQSRFSPPIDEFAQGASGAAAMFLESCSAVGGRIKDTLRLRPDLFTRTIQGSVADFYRSLAQDDHARGLARTVAPRIWSRSATNRAARHGDPRREPGGGDPMTPAVITGDHRLLVDYVLLRKARWSARLTPIAARS